ncbi:MULTISPECIES: hypothetical protein [unclassified Streptomyces]|uniref:hypothetical protein n=1 Tax=unclassified Streptomyces TaxID=2593676 RepID=UPI00068E0118|nr:MULTISPECIES: hypothetical protein [unclassified Streptomyces]APU42781.1 hypothetical protein BSL84_26375 [Streptomyces sp. TN58]
MNRQLALSAPQDPSRGYRLLAEPPSCGVRHLTVCIRTPSDTVTTLCLWGDPEILPQPRTGSYYTVLETGAEELRTLSARLISRWQEFVAYQPSRRQGPLDVLPHTNLADLSGRSAVEVLAQVAELAEEGEYLLDELLAGQGRELAEVRRRLLDLLGRRDLRIRFDSDLDLPWPLLAVGAGHSAGVPGEEPPGDPFAAFLGHRHEIEALAGVYPTAYWYESTRARPASSAWTDEELAGNLLADDVVKLLDDRTELSEHFHGSELLATLHQPVVDHALMYFYCHGEYVRQGDRTWQALRLSDPVPIDASIVDRYRKRHTEANAREGTLCLFHPMVLLNVCFAGAPATAGYAGISAALVKHGALGVLAPSIAMPQVFGAEFALRFLTLYVTDGLPAGRAVLETVRWFAREYRNPLALTYGLVCGMDSRLPASQEGPTRS